MTPHSNEHKKTKEGYLIAIEEELNLISNLPRAFYRLDVATAADLYTCTILSGKSGFLKRCEELEISTEGIFND